MVGVQSTDRETQGVRSRSRCAAAGRSKCTSTLGCACKKVAGICSEIGPSTNFATMGAFASPSAIKMICLDSRIVPIPIVNARIGTCSSPKKSLAESLRVTRSSTMRRVRLARGDPGSLNPMWPVRPTPRICKSIPPAARIFASYAKHDAAAPSALTMPSGTCVQERSIST